MKRSLRFVNEQQSSPPLLHTAPQASSYAINVRWEYHFELSPQVTAGCSKRVDSRAPCLQVLKAFKQSTLSEIPMRNSSVCDRHPLYGRISGIRLLHFPKRNLGDSADFSILEI